MTAAQRSASFRRLLPDGRFDTIERPLAVEMPVAVEIDGIGYAVMMATPDALEDFATGFCLAERLIDRADHLLDIDAYQAERGMLLRLALAPEVRGRVLERVRHRVSESSCGLCGIENLEQALRPLPIVAPPLRPVAHDAVFRALDLLRGHQPLGRETGAVHAAALCDADGTIRLVREDIGRHNAFDKLAGAMARAGEGWGDGFALTTARLSYELVEKAALSLCHTLVAISAPTSLAVERAAEAGVRIIALARPDAALEALSPSD
ncbi:formate dehydrogenase accessory sulfurtransferase FdhD [Sphingomonas oligoaromativorans]|uniref:formate dehydrogenase accessory sulfurtransferase FdhD n=1 Tax=Sphingomonas oligoaromativorans TaxID=575322 RepID=UPI001424555B|nr:formate dehydrogenase accessory sulfurtransferase FdhD [Sphingomonas oligoaromativorans]NIJ32243.1 FdhD protein [Sphingomonas oligoaromativorans]